METHDSHVDAADGSRAPGRQITAGCLVAVVSLLVTRLRSWYVETLFGIIGNGRRVPDVRPH
jgi:hypothetical protein